MSAYLQVQSCLAQASFYVLLMGDSRVASKCGTYAGYPVVNGLAVDGSTTAGVISGQAPCLSGATNPYLPGPVWTPNALMLYVEVGINDIRQIIAGTETFAQFQANSLAIVQGILASGVQPSQLLLSSCTPVSSDPTSGYTNWWNLSIQVAGQWQALAQTYGARYFDLIGAFTNYTYNQADINPNVYDTQPLGGGHYSAAGWELINGLMQLEVNSLGPIAKALPLYKGHL